MKTIHSHLLAIIVLSGLFSVFAQAANKISVDVYEGKQATVNSYIFSNGKSLVVMDVQRSTAEAKKLAEVINNKKLPLTYILITHGHPDHYIGMNWLIKQFPNAKIVVANQAIKNDIVGFSTWMENVGWLEAEPLLKPKSIKNPDGFDYLNNIHVLNRDTLTMDGGGVLKLNTQYAAAESEHVTTVFVDDLNSLFTSDLGYNKVHLWMGQGVSKRHIANWKSILQAFKSTYSDTGIRVYPGHGKPSDTGLFDNLIEYIDTFTEITSMAKSRQQAMTQMTSRYPDYKEANFLLKYSIENHVK